MKNPRRKPAKEREAVITEKDLLLRFHVTLIRDLREPGYSIGCAAFPGCWSEGKTKNEALHNMALAIREYLALTDADLSWAESTLV